MKVTHTYTITIEASPRYREVPCGTKAMEEQQIADACQGLIDATARFWQTHYETVKVKVESKP